MHLDKAQTASCGTLVPMLICFLAWPIGVDMPRLRKHVQFDPFAPEV